jgi:hypothetical protein
MFVETVVRLKIIIEGGSRGMQKKPFCFYGLFTDSVINTDCRMLGRSVKYELEM